MPTGSNLAAALLITSTYYRDNLPQWVQEFNSSTPAKYWDREWKDDQGTVLRSHHSSPGANGADAGFYDVIGGTGFANEYELEFAKQLVSNENIGAGPATDLLAVSLSANDILGHSVGPDTPEMRQMALDLDHQLAEFFKFIGQRVGLPNVWIVLCADHGVPPSRCSPEVAYPCPANRGKATWARDQCRVTAKIRPGIPRAL